MLVHEQRNAGATMSNNKRRGFGKNSIGILLTNLGTPDAPTPAAVRKYLHEFLSDPRVIEIPKIIWWPILHGIILRSRPKKSAKLYQKIWSEQGSPLLFNSQQIANNLQQHLQIPVALGMSYGNPSMQSALEKLRAEHVKKILLLPLYPQYSATTTASTFDNVAKILKKWRHLPEIRTINHYADNNFYLDALCYSIQETWKQYGRAQHLLFSFHSIPQHYVNKGDPYYALCLTTAKSVANKLELKSHDWSLAFQSRLGPTPWLKPYTDKILMSLPQQGITDLQVICPGFAADCLETLEEIAIRGKEQFLSAGGKSFHYIPALNDNKEHIEVLAGLVLRHVQGWE